MRAKDKKACKVTDPRLTNYTKRTRNGSEQCFYTGDDSRDWERYRAEGGVRQSGVTMHDKPDTLRIDPPEKHYYAELIDGEWWWLNGCGECNGRPRDSVTYVECTVHDVCRTCQIPRAKLTEIPWGGMNGWQCKPCADIDAKELRAKRFAAVAENYYNERDCRYTDDVVCPHCGNSYSPDDGVPEGEEQCEVCEGVYNVEPNHSVTYTTTVVGERLTS